MVMPRVHGCDGFVRVVIARGDKANCTLGTSIVHVCTRFADAMDFALFPDAIPVLNERHRSWGGGVGWCSVPRSWCASQVDADRVRE